MARTPKRRPPKRPSFVRGIFHLIGLVLLGGVVIGAVALYSYASHLDGVIRTQFEGKRWALPARVYASPLEAFAGMNLKPGQFATELNALLYRETSADEGPGTVVRRGDSFELTTRGFAFWDGTESPRHLRVSFDGSKLSSIEALDGQPAPGLLRLEPIEIAGIYPAHHEDRILVRRSDLPQGLVDALTAIEDRSFFEHFGIDFKGVIRATVVNMRAGRTVQGASTLTQQLVKNFFLSSERTFSRKLNEMLMAVLIEWHYSKDEILEAYSNEIYLGQDGARAVHGFGLAARFYFDRPLGELELPQMALLAGLVKGPSYYDPRRHPERALERRNLVLDAMAEQGKLTPGQLAAAKAAPLGVSERGQSGGLTRYPIFIDLVQRQLRESYREEDLTSEGLRIFTTLDPRVQADAEDSIVSMLPQLEKSRRMKADTLQGAAVVVRPDNGEVMALVGGRDVRLAGFNRILDARRPAGSLLKPAVYLAALEDPQQFTLATSIPDQPFTWHLPGGGGDWSPRNYEKNFRGRVILRYALAHSMNVPTAWIAKQIGMDRVVDILHRLGARQDLKPYPALVLGAADLSPFEIAQMYQTLASGGYRAPLRAIREVTAQDGKPLTRYPLEIEQVVQPGPAYLVVNAMQAVVREGTATAVYRTLDRKLNLAGKTGTTDDLRDSWFGGFSGNLMTLVWVGRDDNRSTGLTGANGALRVWIDMMNKFNLEPVEMAQPQDVQMASIDPGSGGLADGNCGRALSLPFISGSAPRALAPCHAGYVPPEGYDAAPGDAGDGTEAPAAQEPRSRGKPAEPAPATDSIGDFFKRLMQ